MGKLTLSEAKSLIEKPAFKNTVTKELYDTQDIITLMRDVHEINITKKRTARLAQRLRGKNDKETLYNIYFFVQDCITYIKDTGNERVKEDTAVIWEGYSDCKGMSLVICSICHCLGFHYKYRFVKYIQYWLGIRQVSQHVYPIVVTKSGEAVVMDAVNTVGGFNHELPFDELIGEITSNGFPENIGFTPPLSKNGFWKALGAVAGVALVIKILKK
jgi:hypothetical protein